MIQAFGHVAGCLRSLDELPSSLDGVVWIDALEPSECEEALLATRLGIEVPTRHKMAEIEVSSRLYNENGASFMTCIVPAYIDGANPQMGPISFVLVHNLLLTVRYHEPRAFRSFPKRARKISMGCSHGEGVLVALMEAIVDRIADILERAGSELDRISHDIFEHAEADNSGQRDYRQILGAIGRVGELDSQVRDSLMTMERLVGFLVQGMVERQSSKTILKRTRTLSSDVHSLIDHSGFLSQKITFLLDATLGMINIQQNSISKIFSVAAVVFLPPTLIASIYGMNFNTMPELHWVFGYPFALLLMIVFAVLPYTLVKRRGWL